MSAAIEKTVEESGICVRLSELEKDKIRAMLTACRTGCEYVNALKHVLTTYSGSEWKQVLPSLADLENLYNSPVEYSFTYFYYFHVKGIAL